MAVSPDHKKLQCDVCSSRVSVDPSLSCPAGDKTCMTAVCDEHEADRERIHRERGCYDYSGATAIAATPGPLNRTIAAVATKSKPVPVDVDPDFFDLIFGDEEFVVSEYGGYIFIGGVLNTPRRTITGQFSNGQEIMSFIVSRESYSQVSEEGKDVITLADFARYCKPRAVQG